jgi:hypothetical protein
MQTGAASDRENVVINALRVVTHTQLVDPDFVKHCLGCIEAMNNKPGFGALLEQNEVEFSQMLSHIGHCRSALEIGSRYGKSMQRIAAAIQPRSRIVAVDMPYSGGYGDAPAPEPILMQSMEAIDREGHEVHLFIGDSHSEEVVKMVRDLAPFDFCFIDGDHSYEGAKADWENYGPMAKIVAFHDIVNNVGCFKLWNEIKAAGHRTVEYTSSVWLGIGMVFR